MNHYLCRTGHWCQFKNMPRALYDEIVYDIWYLRHQKTINIRLLCPTSIYRIRARAAYIRLPFIDCALSRYVPSNNVGSHSVVWWMAGYYISYTVQRISRTPSALYRIKTVSPCIGNLITKIIQLWIKTYLKDICNGSLAFANEKNDMYIEHGYHMTECPLGSLCLSSY